jgi:hypothetical protein
MGRYLRVKATEPLTASQAEASEDNPQAWTEWPRITAVEVYRQGAPAIAGLPGPIPFVALTPVSPAYYEIAPLTGNDSNNYVPAGSGYTARLTGISPAIPENGRYAANTAYTFTFTLTPEAGKRIIATAPNMNERPASITPQSDGRTLNVSYSFPATRSDIISTIAFSGADEPMAGNSKLITGTNYSAYPELFSATLTAIESDDSDGTGYGETEYKLTFLLKVIEGYKFGTGVEFPIIGSSEPDVEWITPDEEVTLEYVFDLTPDYTDYTVTIPDNYGSFTVTGLIGNTAKRYDVIQITNIANNEGYKPKVPPTATLTTVGAVGTVTFTRIEGGWSFVMPSSNITIDLFEAWGNFDIYRGRWKPWLQVVELTATNGTWAYPPSTDYVTLDGTGQGRNGGRAIIYNKDQESPGERSFGLNLNEAIALGGTGALSFWMRIDGEENDTATVEWVGFGNDSPEQVVIWGGTVNETNNQYNQNIIVTNQWQRYIVPVPVPKTTLMMNRVFFWKSRTDKTVYIDDIEYVPAAEVTLTNIFISDYTGEDLPLPSADGVALLNGAMRFSYTHNGVSATLTAPGAFAGNLGHNWSRLVQPADYTFIVGGDATLSLDGLRIIPDHFGASFTLRIRLGTGNATSNEISAKFTSDIESVLLDDFAAGPGNGGWIGDLTGVNPPAGYWRINIGHNGENWIGGETGRPPNYDTDNPLAGGNGYVDSEDDNLKTNGRYMQLVSYPAGSKFGRNLPSSVDLSVVNTLSVWFQRKATGDTYSIGLYNGGTFQQGENAETGTRYAVPLVPTGEVGKWEKIQIPISAFAGLGLDLRGITGWGIYVVNKTTTNDADGTFLIESLTATYEK